MHSLALLITALSSHTISESVNKKKQTAALQLASSVNLAALGGQIYTYVVINVKQILFNEMWPFRNSI